VSTTVHVSFAFGPGSTFDAQSVAIVANWLYLLLDGR